MRPPPYRPDPANRRMRIERAVKLSGLLLAAILMTPIPFTDARADIGGSETASAFSTGRWRDEVVATRRLMENDGNRAYEETRRLMAALPVGAGAADRARALNLIARAELYLAMTDSARRKAERALVLADEAGDPVGRAEAHLVLSVAAINQARFNAAMTAPKAALEALDGVTDRPDLLCEAMLRLGIMYQRLDRSDDAITLAMQSMEVARRSGNSLALAHAHSGLAQGYDGSGHRDHALHHYQEMAKYARRAGTMRLEANALLGIGSQLQALGAFDESEKKIREALALFRRVGTPFSVAQALHHLGAALRAKGHEDQAVPLLDEQVAIFDNFQNKIGLWWALDGRADLRQALGDTEGAARDTERGRRLAEEIGLVTDLRGSAELPAGLASERGDYTEAYALYLEARRRETKSSRERTRQLVTRQAGRYQEESRQRKIHKLTDDNERQQQEFIRRTLHQRWLWTLAIGALLTLAVIVFFLARQRRTNRLLAATNAELALRNRALDRVHKAAFLVDHETSIGKENGARPGSTKGG